MQITDLLARTGGLDAIARELGLDPQQAASGAEALAPALLDGFRQQAQGQGGGLMDILGKLGGGDLLDQVVSPRPTDVTAGDAVLGQVFGSREVSRNVAQEAAATSGLDPALLKKMLPMLAMVVAGLMSKGNAAAGGSGGLGGMLGGLFGGGSQQAGGLGGLGGLLDANGDGSALDDLVRMAGRLGR